MRLGRGSGSARSDLSPESFYAARSVGPSPSTRSVTAPCLERRGVHGGGRGGLPRRGRHVHRPLSGRAASERRGGGPARLRRCELLVGKLGIPVSADTEPRRCPRGPRSRPGARIINDVRGLAGDPALARAVAEAGAGLIVMASERGGHEGVRRWRRCSSTSTREPQPRPRRPGIAADRDRRGSRARLLPPPGHARGTSGTAGCWLRCPSCGRWVGPSAWGSRGSPSSARWPGRRRPRRPAARLAGRRHRRRPRRGAAHPGPRRGGDGTGGPGGGAPSAARRASR